MKDASGTITHDEMKALVGAADGGRDAPPAPRSRGYGETEQKMPSKSRTATKRPYADWA